VLERDSALSYKISRQSDNHSLRYSQKTIFNMAAVRHFEFAKFGILLSNQPWKHTLHLHTKFRWNRMIFGWDIAIKLFSRWRPSTVLNFRNLVFWSYGLC